ncbi:H(+)/Cl(-) exchange transporter ClcA [Andreprevotia sp. IGB-42]|uniref:chloride channel protein n=1 Tax=Andreprevotia sp. IGB-42 TaxID=2497473 RepID=UPI001359B67B|nr:chloride channel protein [Andreprevotia sp. IGB-42]KAF0812140.1 H(+)/Cl(-) exchange transporter ClcA [Andreprevotia sp. IGB-42]
MAFRRDYTVNRRLVLLSGLAMLIGIASTLAAKLLILLIRFFTNLFFFQTLSLAEHSPAQHHLGWWVIVLPAIGGLVVGLMARYGSEKIRGHGIPEAMEAILFGKSRMSARVAVLKPLSSGIVIGSGGPFGAEGPITMTGGSLGSLLAQYLHVSAGERKTLLVAGACAGMTAIFGTPVAAVLLAVELLLFELRPRSLLPVGLACAVAGFLRTPFFEAGPLFPLQTAPVQMAGLGSCITAGLLIGLLAVFVTWALHQVEDGFARLPMHWMWWPALGGLAVGLGGYLVPRALGVGYDVIADLLNSRLDLAVVAVLIGIKLCIWLLALGSGTSGGVLAPLLMVGAGVGVLLSPWLPGGSPGLWSLVCMAALLGSALGAPLTAVVFAFGLTHDGDALLPIMLATLVAWGLATLLQGRSIMTGKIARRGLHVYREYGVDPLERSHVGELMQHGVVAFNAGHTAGYAQRMLRASASKLPAYPLVSRGKLLGMIGSVDLFGAADDALLLDLVSQEAVFPALAYPEEPARVAAARMNRHALQCLPVVTSAANHTFLGLLTANDLLRPGVEAFSQENTREKLR